MYAKNRVLERVELWNELEVIGSSIQEPWILSGDFNAILSSDDRMGTHITPSEIQDFRNCVDHLQLIPLTA